MTTASSQGPSLILAPPSIDASSLRAAALKTLKLGKRRRPASGQPQIIPPSRPIPQDTFQLDYGQEDNLSEPSPPQVLVQVASSTGSLPQSITSAPPSPLPMDVDTREEGEISDEDTSPIEIALLARHLEQPNGAFAHADHPSVPPAPPQLKSPVPALLTRLSIPQSRIPSTSDSPASSIPYAERTRIYPPSDSSRGQPITSVSYFARASSRERSSHYHANRSSSPNTYFVPAHDSVVILDAAHVRPGLNMTQEEYDAAKDIVLDLLGWGVPPEYLVDCGLSRQLVYYVFTELHLKLPSNLDTSGIVSYQPSIYPPISPPSADDQLASQLISGVRDPVQRSRSSASPERVIASTSPVKASSPPSAMAPTSEDLHDMERQRRQELLARKKVAQASRKVKQRGTTDRDSSGVQPFSRSDTDIAMTLPAPTETVDNFLKSIDPANQAEVSPRHGTEAAIADAVGMDVDEIPGLGNARASLPISSSPTSYLAPPFSEDSAITPFSSAQPTEEIDTHLSLPPRKRATRRPVASDFVDVDDPHSPSSSSGAPGTTRFRLSSSMSFASISNMRRCIIDLSDSENDDDQLEDSDKLKRSQMTPAVSALTNSNTSNLSSRSSPVPLASIKLRSATITPSPDALALETKIRKMREEIAHREQNQKRKALAKLSTVYTNDAVIPASVTASSVATPLESREQSIVPQSYTYFESTFALDNTPDHDWSQADTTFRDNSSASGDGKFFISSLDGTSHSQTSGTPSYHSYEGLQAQATELRLSGAQVNNAMEAIDSDEQEPLSPTSDADLNSSLSARAPEDIQEHGIEFYMNLSPNAPGQTFRHYQSTLSNYPLLRTQVTPPRLYTSDPFVSDVCTAHWNTTASSVGDYSHSERFILADLENLKLATVMKHLDPSKQLCQYEVAGSGVCRDEGCDDVHLRRLLANAEGEGVEPSDLETASFLLGLMPGDWQARNNVTLGKMIAALTMVRQSASLMNFSFEERVARALVLLERSPVPKT